MNRKKKEEWEMIELRQEKIDELLGKTPSWLVNWGMIIIFIFVIIIFIVSLIFKYPETIQSSVVIISENPPASLVANINGKIDTLLVRNGDTISSGKYVVILENPSKFQHVVLLEKKIAELQIIFSSQDFSKLEDLSENYLLGSIQPAFSNFQRQYNEFKKFISLNLIEKKIISVNQQIKDYDKYIEKLKLQILNQEQAVLLGYKQYKRDSILYMNEVIAQAEIEKTEQLFIQVKNNYQNLLASLSNAQMQINQLNFQIIDLTSQRVDQIGNIYNLLKESFENLKSSLAEWKNKYALQSPIDGIVTFNRFWSENQFVLAGEVVFTIIPFQTNKIIGRIRFPVAGSGKVKNQQFVNIKVENYSFLEYGMLKGIIKSISLIPEYSDEGWFYTAEISLPNGMITNYNKTLPFLQEMRGSAEIITNDLSIFQRVLNPVKAALRKSI